MFESVMVNCQHALLVRNQGGFLNVQVPMTNLQKERKEGGCH